jgi:hypothetical protein
MHARNINACYVRPIDCDPTDILRSVRVCVVGVSTSHTSKRRLAFSVSFIDATTRTACAGRVARIDELSRDTGSLGLIQDKALQLAERPTVQTTSLLFTSPYPSLRGHLSIWKPACFDRINGFLGLASFYDHKRFHGLKQPKDVNQTGDLPRVAVFPFRLFNGPKFFSYVPSHFLKPLHERKISIRYLNEDNKLAIGSIPMTDRSFSINQSCDVSKMLRFRRKVENRRLASSTPVYSAPLQCRNHGRERYIILRSQRISALPIEIITNKRLSFHFGESWLASTVWTSQVYSTNFGKEIPYGPICEIEFEGQLLKCFSFGVCRDKIFPVSLKFGCHKILFATDSLEILKSNTAFGALSSANYLLRNPVVYVGREPLLFSASPAHKTLGSFRALLLKLASQTSVASSAAIYGRSSEARAIRGLRYRNESHIDPDPPNSLFLFLVRNIDGSKKEPLLISVNKIGLASLEPDQTHDDGLRTRREPSGVLRLSRC